MRICPGLPHRKGERRRRNSPDGGIIEASLEADGAERGKADTETDDVPPAERGSQ
jgi:hypothetical protein